MNAKENARHTQKVVNPPQKNSQNDGVHVKPSQGRLRNLHRILSKQLSKKAPFCRLFVGFRIIIADTVDSAVHGDDSLLNV